MADIKVTTGAIALVKVAGEVIGKMKDITITENLGRVEVRGLGTIFAQEVPVVSHSGTVSCSYYLINWEKARAKGSVRRDVQDKNEYEDYLVLQEEGIQLDVFKKVTDLIDPQTKLPKAKLEPLAIVKGVYSDNESINIAEGQVGGHNQSFRFTEPVIFPK